MKYVPRLTVLLLFLLASNVAYSETFIVTSNADSGTGTLREAIEKANTNGTATVDFIHFNIPGVTEADRTIILLSNLSALTSNIVLDASTQPGASFGVSNAKIHITTDGSYAYSQCFILNNVENIEIYGFYITNFSFNDPDVPAVPCAIWMEKIVKNVKIGAPGKGNVFFKNTLAICTPYGYSSNEGHHFFDIDVKSNFFNLDIDGITFTWYDAWTCVLISSFANITIGGDNLSDGNFFAGLNGNSVELISDNNTGNGVLNIKNNKFGLTFDQSSAVPCGLLSVSGYEFSLWNQTYSDLQINIIGNKFRNPAVQFSNSCHGMIGISRIIGFITITGNTIGILDGVWTDCQTSGIFLAECKNAIIGGDNAAEQNIIASNSYAGVALRDNENVTIRKNTFVCNGKGIEAVSSIVAIPVVKIMETNNVDYVAGTATPNCKIEVFQNIKECLKCNNGEIYMGETTSDAVGNWSFTGVFNAPVTARATSATGVTGEFSAAKFIQAPEYQGPTCGKDNGYIKGAQVVSGTKYYWIRRYNGQRDTIFNKLDLVDVGPGYYEFVVEQTKYCSVSYSIELKDLSPKIYTQNITINNPSCGKPIGSILNLTSSGLYDKIFWLSDNRDTVGTLFDLENVFEGKYKLFVLNEKDGCGDSTSYYTLTNQSGPTLQINNARIVASTCGGVNGSITGITVSNHIGNKHVEWRDSANNLVSSTFDLVNQPAGKYRLKYKDDGGCDTITTPYFTIPSIGAIAIDVAKKQIWTAGCTVANGMIAGITVTGADNLQWKNIDDNAVVGNAATAEHLEAGNYQLTATNLHGCTKTSATITIPVANFIPVQPANPIVKNAACGQSNGSIQLTGFGNEAALASYKWINSVSQQDLGSQLSISGLGEGSYELIATDTNGCVKTIFDADIMVNAKPQIDNGNANIVDDKCDLSQAGISGLRVTGLANAPAYSWTDADGVIVSSSIDLSGVGSGRYQLTVKDGDFCTVVSDPYVIENDNTDPLPQYEDQIIPRNTAATLKINNYKEGLYRLYADIQGMQLIEENSTGIFNTQTLTADQSFYVQHELQSCISAIKQVRITVIDKSEFAVPNAFTPNGDYLNDVLHASVIGFINLEYFRIFNRFGKEVFAAKNLNDGWDGRINGVEQPGGVYIWMAKGKDLLGNPVESKGTVVLIR